jgi:hypothetical protein
MKKLQDLCDIIRESEEDFDKFFTEGNQAAGIRVRRKMQGLKILAHEIRCNVQRVRRERGKKKEEKKPVRRSGRHNK